MTLASTNTKVTYNGDDSTVIFPVTFIFFQNSDLRVILRDALGAETVWVEGTQYTLAGGAGSTGTLTVKTTPTDYTPATGEKLLIKSAIPETQGAALPLGGAFPSTTVEQMVDIVTRLVQQNSEEVARALVTAETDDNPGTLPTSTVRASKFLAFDATGLAIVSPGSVDTVTVSAYGATLVDDADAGTALTTLGVSAFIQTLLDDADAAAARTTLGAKVVLGTEQATTSGTTISITGIPVGVKWIKLMLRDVSVSGNNDIDLTLGDAGGIEATGYVGVTWDATTSTGWSTNAQITEGTATADVWQGLIDIVLMDEATNTWVIRGSTIETNTPSPPVFSVGHKSLSDTLTQLQLKTESADTFDAGAVNIQYGF